jgi:hypothetical protein
MLISTPPFLSPIKRAIWSEQLLAQLAVARANASQGADADATRVRALAAYKYFFTLGKDADPRHFHSETSQGRIREAAVAPFDPSHEPKKFGITSPAFP